jgi:glycosyltransferase involved in cell wall biosynthesis
VIWNAPPPPAAVPALPARFTIGYVGNVREPGMFQNLIAALAQLAPEQRPAVRIAGEGRSAETVQRMFEDARSGLGLSVTLSGAFRSSDVGALMAECSLQYCVYPTRRGNIDRAMPVKLLESVAHGRRVIGNRDSLMGEWISDNDWGWVVREDDPAALAAALRDAHARCAAEGRLPPRLARPPLWPEQERRLVAAYERLLA